MRRRALLPFPLAILLVAACLTLVPGISSTPARAECENYEDYLHWVGGMTVGVYVRDVYIQDDYAYVIGFHEAYACSLIIIDVSNEADPQRVGGTPITIGAQMIHVDGDTAAIAADHADADGLHLYDVSDRSNPLFMSSSQADVRSQSVYLDGDRVYMSCRKEATGQDVMRFIYVDSLASPKDVNTTTRTSGRMVKRDHYLYVPIYGSIRTFYVANLSGFGQVDSDGTSPYQLRELAISGNRLYALGLWGSGHDRLYCFNLSLQGPGNPYEEEYLRINEGYENDTVYGDIAIAGSTCYIANQYHDIEMVDISTIPGMETTGFIQCNDRRLACLRATDTKLYYTSLPDSPSVYQSEIDTYTLSSPEPYEPIGTIDTPGEAISVVVPDAARSTTAYVADGAAGLQIVDVTDPLYPSILGTVDTPGYASDVVVEDTLAYVADGSAGLQVIALGARQIIGAEDTPGSAVALAVEGDYAYVADSAAGLRVIDVFDPRAPFECANVDSVDGESMSVLGVALNDTFAYLAAGIHGLVALSVDEPDDPWVIGGVKSRDVADARSVEVRENRAYVTDEDVGLSVVDVADPRSPTILSTAEVVESAGDVDLLGIFALVGDGDAARFIDLRDETDPQNVGYVELPDEARRVFVNEDYAYIAAGSTGVHVCPSQCGFDEAVGAAFTAVPEQEFIPATIEFQNASIGYGLDYAWDFGDSVGTSTERHPIYTYNDVGAYTVTLNVSNGVNADSAASVVCAVEEPPVILDVTDVPHDDGGYVYVHFFRSAYDTDVLGRAELYTIERQDDGVWVTLMAFGAYGAHYYTVLAPTLGDGPEWETPFRVIANMDQGNWASDPVSGYSINDSPTAVPDVVAEVELSQARPNPFNPTTEIGYALPAVGRVTLRVFDVGGRLVSTLVDREVPPGRHLALWSGRDNSGRAVASGVYFYQLDAGGKTLRKSMTLLK